MMGLYILGIAVGILVALVYRKTLFKGEAVPFVMELPNYRLPGAKMCCRLLWEKSQGFYPEGFYCNLHGNYLYMVPSQFQPALLALYKIQRTVYLP